MKKDPADYTSKQLLEDNSFLRWTLFDTSEDKQYWENYIRENPEMEARVCEAGNMLKVLVRFNDYTLSEEESRSISQAIRNRLLKKKKKKLLLIRTSIAAACVLLVLIRVMFSISEDDQKKPIQSEIVKSEYGVTKDEGIRMVIGEQDYLHFDRNVDIKYDASGSIIIVDDKQEITKIVSKSIMPIALNTLIVPKGKRSSLLLADGTKIWVNSGTTIDFPAVFNGNKREIKVEGEIYIEVAKDPEKPFVVNASDVSVKVTGTRFNLSSYEEDPFSRVVLVEGQVEVSSKSENYLLYPDQLFSLENENVTIAQVDVYDYISWKDGLLQFNSESLSLILQRLSRYYDVSFVFGEEIGDMKCSGKLVLFDDITPVLETISNTLSVRFEVNNNNEILIDKK